MLGRTKGLRGAWCSLWHAGFDLIPQSPGRASLRRTHLPMTAPSRANQHAIFSQRDCISASSWSIWLNLLSQRVMLSLEKPAAALSREPSTAWTGEILALIYSRRCKDGEALVMKPSHSSNGCLWLF